MPTVLDSWLFSPHARNANMCGYEDTCTPGSPFCPKPIPIAPPPSAAPTGDIPTFKPAPTILSQHRSVLLGPAPAPAISYVPAPRTAGPALTYTPTFAPPPVAPPPPFVPPPPPMMPPAPPSPLPAAGPPPVVPAGSVPPPLAPSPFQWGTEGTTSPALQARIDNAIAQAAQQTAAVNASAMAQGDAVPATYATGQRVILPSPAGSVPVYTSALPPSPASSSTVLLAGAAAIAAVVAGFFFVIRK